MELSFIGGGVAAPKGFTANGIHCGIRKNKEKKDLALIYCEKDCDAAAVYTQNLVCGAPITVTRENISDGKARAIVCNSGIANTCNADGVEKAEEMCKITADALGISKSDIVVASTGVIGQPIDLEPIKNGMAKLVSGLNKDGSDSAANAIMTTDTVKKEFACEFSLGGKKCRIGAISKGSGMIHPNMATMLSVTTTDAKISHDLLQEMVSEIVSDSFNMISVDRDTSTNDTYLVLANGESGVEIKAGTNGYVKFKEALSFVATDLAKQMAADGEGATRLMEVRAVHCKNKEEAKIFSKSVVTSNLVKAMVFGKDANWGRVLCALGYSGADFDPDVIDLILEAEDEQIVLVKDGVPTDYSEDEATILLGKDAVTFICDMKQGDASAIAWGCDLTYDYVKINGDYRS